ncbi:hypothetical protein HIM_06592 [Hirsutella minnesotensis 3608]|uniref:20S-pre-rRNA D-site endonuclease NOB1 n=1 Tax=Hirsutella minnesotensis 3608 TaxID=1043627 RepID=A0A0F8A4P2_9HYPO|nr:hypothetical protein HIM_06592 [Hirsutella minnesotensis 3608]
MAASSTEPSSNPIASSSDGPTLKPIHSLILDTGPLIKNDPPASVLIAQAEKLYTLPSVIPEIRDPVTRSRVETTLLPFVTVRSPRPESLKFVRDFARRTGDLEVLSRPDLEVLALGYELECERNNGDWRLRRTPGQKGLNGRPEKRDDETTKHTDSEETEAQAEEAQDTQSDSKRDEPETDGAREETTQEAPEKEMEQLKLGEDVPSQGETNAEPVQVNGEKQDETVEAQDEVEDDSDSDGWITPSNVKKHQAKDAGSATPAQAPQRTLQAAILTSDYAMQNVALRINLNLVTPSLARITHVKNWVLRCHGCFAVTRDMERQFCPSCGQPTLMRASCSTDQHGNFRVHLKRNFQWNNRGNVYSVPRPVHGSSNGRLPPGVGGGKGGWGRDLILAEDQKEYTRAADERRRARKKDLMDDDYLPGILSGDRSGGAGGRIRVGAGRNVNSKRKH